MNQDPIMGYELFIFDFSFFLQNKIHSCLIQIHQVYFQKHNPIKKKLTKKY